jgi:hypothetical protein
VHNDGSDPNPGWADWPARIEFSAGEPLVVVTDSSWKSGSKEAAGWKDAGFDEAGWVAAQKLGPAGMAPWGESAGRKTTGWPRGCCAGVRMVEKKVRRAMAYVCGLGLSEFYLNGREGRRPGPVAGAVGLHQAGFYVTFDVTKQLKKGANAAGSSWAMAGFTRRARRCRRAPRAMASQAAVPDAHRVSGRDGGGGG